MPGAAKMDSLKYVELCNMVERRFIGNSVPVEEFKLLISEAGKANQKLQTAIKKMFPEIGEPSPFPKNDLQNCLDLPFLFGTYKEGSKAIYGLFCITKALAHVQMELELSLKLPSKETSALVISESVEILFLGLAYLSKYTGISFEESMIESFKALKKARPGVFND